MSTRPIQLAIPVKIGVLVAIVAVAALVGALAASFGPLGTGAQAGGQIHGCISVYSGALRIVPTPEQCSAAEYPVSWDQFDQVAEIDILRVRNDLVIETEDERDSAFVYVACPDGYTVVGGGAGRTFSSGSDKWFMDASSPRLPGDPGSIGDFAGWTASFETLDGEDAEGQYGFFVEAMCLSTGQ